MKIGIATAVYNNDFNKIRAHGYQCIDFDLCNTSGEIYHLPEEEFAAEIIAEKTRIEAAGLTISQVHGPWPTDDKSESSRAEKMHYMQRAVRATALLNCPYMVVHPVMPYGWSGPEDADAAFDMNVCFFRELCDYGAPWNVTVCVENMPMKALRLSPMPAIVELVQRVDRQNCGICLDTGHVNVFDDDIGDMVRLCAPYLKILHVHDNDGRRDLHLIPYMGTVKWDHFTKALRDIGFEGVLSMETKVSHAMPASLRAQTLALLAATANELAKETL